MGASTAAGTSLVKVASIGAACKDHIARVVGDAVVSVRGKIIEEFLDSFRGGLGRRGLLGAYGSESDKKSFSNARPYQKRDPTMPWMRFTPSASSGEREMGAAGSWVLAP